VQAITAKELELRGSFRFHEEFFAAVELMRKGRIDVKPLITHEVALDEAEEGFKLASDRSRAMKAQIRFS
jgi:L-idonate 5-dehydrogenase